MSDFVPAGQSTQIIVGASPEPDRRILLLTEDLYRVYRLKRVYFSAFVQVTGDPRLPDCPSPPLRRENRLYQADWLLRFYGFRVDEILDETQPDLDLRLDPKLNWALRHREQFPVELTKADYGRLLRVPGIGRIAAGRILRARRAGGLSFDRLPELGVVMKRAVHFSTCGGKGLVDLEVDPDRLRERLIQEADPGKRDSRWGQLYLFNDPAEGRQ